MRLAYFALPLVLLPACVKYFPKAYATPNTIDAIPNAQTCMVPSRRSGKPAIQVLQRVGPTAFAAEASWGVGYLPTITYSLSYFRLEPKIQLFLSLHECGHLVLRTTNEFQANCYAVTHAAWTEPDLDLIGRRHEAVGLLPPQYGGSGHAFWVGTQKTCPQSFTQHEIPGGTRITRASHAAAVTSTQTAARLWVEH
jgi:hypothetical protein